MTPILNLPDRLPSFDQRFAFVDAILPESQWQPVRNAVDALVETERSYLPTHKKGGTVAYETLAEKAPAIVALYRSEALRELISQITGLSVVPTPLHDQSSCSILFYEKPGDHIGWHYDHNFYKGRHFTVLIPVINRDSQHRGLSAARLYAKLGGEDVEVATPPNRLIVFEGARVRHKVTPIAEGERRVVWSMTYCADPRNSAWQGVARRVKDTAFFGIRALWT
ncbi:MAG: 2OG-Fe(II) oxygenase [Rhizobiales bacterium]|nr:2OG-Fe(II) oxygenase [Hyphomicrobiales bacterium]